MQIETVKTDKFTMDFFRFGSGKENLVILPGLSVQSVMLSADDIAEAYRALADDLTVYVFSRRNELPPVYSLWEMASDTADAICALNLGRVSVFGASQGGMIAMKLAIDRPELVKCLILGSSSAFVTPERYRFFEGLVCLAKDGNKTELCKMFAKAIYPQEIFSQIESLVPEAASLITDDDIYRFIILTESLRDVDLIGELNKIVCPALVLGSKDDKVLGEEASLQLRDQIKNSELFLYDGYGHAVYDLAPDYKTRMLSFLFSHLGE
ncbi:MAG: alpha/beta hydrolase [Clostridiales bacterium]|nr:alpha/beta hydrolase [Clostridiales bacterium]